MRILQKVQSSRIPSEDIPKFMEVLEYRYKSGKYTLPKSIVMKYQEILNVSSMSLYNGSSKYYLRDFTILPPEALYDYYLIVKKSGCLRRDV